jgi:hypothetical protein
VEEVLEVLEVVEVVEVVEEQEQEKEEEEEEEEEKERLFAGVFSLATLGPFEGLAAVKFLGPANCSRFFFF